LCFAAAPAQAQDKPVTTVFASEVVEGSDVAYLYTLVNHSGRPITSVWIGYDYFSGAFELTQPPVGWNSMDGLPAESAASPTGWHAEAFSEENSNFTRIDWSADESTATYDLLPEQTLEGFRVVVSVHLAEYLSAHWTVVFDDGTIESGLLQRRPAPASAKDNIQTMHQK
jgi:hypothetical protein